MQQNTYIPSYVKEKQAKEDATIKTLHGSVVSARYDAATQQIHFIVKDMVDGYKINLTQQCPDHPSFSSITAQLEQSEYWMFSYRGTGTITRIASRPFCSIL